MTTIIKRPATVRISNGGATVIRLDRSTVARIANNRPSIAVTDRASRVGVTQQTNTVRAGANIGPQGPQGEDGLSGGGTVSPVAFSFGDASGTIFTPAATGTLTTVRVVFTTRYDGDGATFALGTLASPGAAMSTNDNNPAVAAEYEVTADLPLAAGEALRLTQSPGAGATQGAGLIYLTFIPD